MPNISVSEPRIHLGHQFRGLPFNACIKLVNSSEIPAAYKVLPQTEQNEDDLSCLLFCAPKPEVCTAVLSVVLTYSAVQFVNYFCVYHFIITVVPAVKKV